MGHERCLGILLDNPGVLQTLPYVSVFVYLSLEHTLLGGAFCKVYELYRYARLRGKKWMSVATIQVEKEKRRGGVTYHCRTCEVERAMCWHKPSMRVPVEAIVQKPCSYIGHGLFSFFLVEAREGERSTPSFFLGVSTSLSISSMSW